MVEKGKQRTKRERERERENVKGKCTRYIVFWISGYSSSALALSDRYSLSFNDRVPRISVYANASRENPQYSRSAQRLSAIEERFIATTCLVSLSGTKHAFEKRGKKFHGRDEKIIGT